MLSTACSSDWTRLRRGVSDAVALDDATSDIVALDGAPSDAETPTDAVVSPDVIATDGGGLAGRQIVSGDNFVCTYTVGGSDLRCIGDNTEGQLGLGTLDLRSTPVALTGLPAGAIVHQAAAGARSLCVLATVGATRGVWCAGSRVARELGDGDSETPVRRAEFVAVQGLDSVGALLELVSSATSTCVIAGATRALHCWGQLDYRLARRPIATRLTNTDGTGVEGVAKLWLGAASMYVQSADGSLRAMGLRDTGLLLNGPGTGGAQSTLVAITNAPAMPTTIDSNAGNACAVSAGQVFCWGSGAGSWSDAMPAPTVARLPAGEEALDVKLGERHACALTRSGGVFCWGNNALGALGSMLPRVGSANPTRVALAAEAASIAVGFNHSCALLRSGVVQCWGSGAYGQLGHSVALGPRDLGRPSRVLGLGANATCTGDGAEMRCFGEHDRWAGLDYRLVGDRAVLRLPSGTITNISVSPQLFSTYLMCATSTEGALYCAGNPPSDFTSMGAPLARPQGVREADMTRRAIAARNVAIGSGFALAVDAANPTVYGWGEGRSGAFGGQGVGDLTYASALNDAQLTMEPLDPIDASVDVVCGRRTGTGALLCWGYDGHGQAAVDRRTYANFSPSVINLGTMSMPLPFLVATGRRAISVGMQHVCAIGHTTMDPQDTLYCWGWNEHFQSALTGDWVTRPTRTGLPTGAVAVAAGMSHTCMLTAAGVIRCWGDNRYGQLGVGAEGFVTANSATTVALPAGEIARDIDAGFRHTCVRTESNRTFCWGWNGFGQVAPLASTLPFSLVPQSSMGL
jgi:alpha-tubulin suppressor-like RCC1 family protein